MIDVKNFNPSGATLLLAATTTAANGTAAQTLNNATNSSPLYDVRVVNTGTAGQTAMISWGNTATSTTGQPVLGNTDRIFNVGGYPSVFSAIMLSGSANVYITPGQGI